MKKSISRTAIIAGLLLAASALALQAAQAQATAPKLVTIDELRACMDSESALAGRRQAMEARGAREREEAAAIREEQQQLADEQKRIVEAMGSMDRFERKVRAHNARVGAARAGGESLRTELQAFNQTLTAHNERCGAISFRPEDREAILKERGAAKKD